MASKVTVITPIYNGEKYIEQYIYTLAAQTYSSVELIIVNDGSTDQSLSLINEKKKILEEKGWQIKVLTQKNQGAAAAVNKALKEVTGDYLMLFDVDDILMPDNIKAKALFLDENPDYGMVRHNGYMVNEDDLNNQSQLFVMSEEEKKKEWIFDDLVYARINNWSASYMLRFSFFVLQNPGLEIYISQYGQNLQPMLPMARFYKTGFIDQPLMKYIIYRRSHSHCDNGYRILNLRLGFTMNRIGVINTMTLSEDEKKYYNKRLRKIYAVQKIIGLIDLKASRKSVWNAFIETLSLQCFPVRTLIKAIFYVIFKF